MDFTKRGKYLSAQNVNKQNQPQADSSKKNKQIATDLRTKIENNESSKAELLKHALVAKTLLQNLKRSNYKKM